MEKQLKLMSYTGGAITAWCFGVSMGWYPFPTWSPWAWVALWILSGLVFISIPGKLNLEA